MKQLPNAHAAILSKFLRKKLHPANTSSQYFFPFLLSMLEHRFRLGLCQPLSCSTCPGSRFMQVHPSKYKLSVAALVNSLYHAWVFTNYGVNSFLLNL